MTRSGYAVNKTFPLDRHFNKFHTLYDVLWGNRLLFRLVANLIGFRRYKVNEFSAAVHDQLSCVVDHPDIRESLFDHLIYSSSINKMRVRSSSLPDEEAIVPSCLLGPNF